MPQSIIAHLENLLGKEEHEVWFSIVLTPSFHLDSSTPFRPCRHNLFPWPWYYGHDIFFWLCCLLRLKNKTFTSTHGNLFRERAGRFPSSLGSLLLSYCLIVGVAQRDGHRHRHAVDTSQLWALDAFSPLRASASSPKWNNNHTSLTGFWWRLKWVCIYKVVKLVSGRW